MTKQLKTAFRAADAARATALQYWRTNLSIDTKINQNDLVTKADLENNTLILDIIQKTFPDHDTFSEELDAKETGSEYQWVIDPIDGTFNFTMGQPIFGVSIALLKNNLPYLGVIDLPAVGERYWAEQGKGAWVQRDSEKKPRALAVSSRDTINTSRWGIGFYPTTESRKRCLTILNQFLIEAQATRIHYCAVFDLANVARGGMDFYINIDFNLWDFAAGWCIVQEAGGELVNLDGTPATRDSKNIIAANKIVTAEVVQKLQKLEL